MKDQSNFGGTSANAGRKSLDTNPSWPGTRRYGFRPAPPGGLALVQDFLNTRAHAEEGPDLLDDAEHC